MRLSEGRITPVTKHIHKDNEYGLAALLAGDER